MDESSDVSRRAVLRGGAGAATATAAGTATAQEGADGDGGGGGTERPVWPDYVSDARDQGYEDLRGQSDVTIQVGAGSDGLSFAPTFVWIDPGTDVTWEWTGEGGGHNVVANSGADFRSGDPVSEAGTTFTHTVEEAGMVDYYCNPHEGLGMKGAIAVGADVETETIGGGGGTPVDPEHMGVPFHPHYVGVATIVMMVVSLLFAFFVLKYGESPHTSGGSN
jgi:halocyanin-like protein